jgi:hypothetical protein
MQQQDGESAVVLSIKKFPNILGLGYPKIIKNSF